MSFFRRPKILMAEPGTNPLEEPIKDTKGGSIFGLVMACLLMGACLFSGILYFQGKGKTGKVSAQAPSATPSPISLPSNTPSQVIATPPLTATPIVPTMVMFDPNGAQAHEASIITQIVKQTKIVGVPIYVTRMVNQTVVVYITGTPFPTYTPYPSHTPYPTYTSYPTFTQPPPTVTPIPPTDTPVYEEPTAWIITVEVTSTFTPTPTETPTEIPTETPMGAQ